MAVPLSPLNERVDTATAVVLVAGPGLLGVLDVLDGEAVDKGAQVQPRPFRVRQGTDLLPFRRCVHRLRPSSDRSVRTQRHERACAKSTPPTTLRGFNTDDVKATQLVACFDDVKQV